MTGTIVHQRSSHRSLAQAEAGFIAAEAKRPSQDFPERCRARGAFRASQGLGGTRPSTSVIQGWPCKALLTVT